MMTLSMNLKRMQLASGLAGILAVLSLDATFAAAEELQVEYEDHRLTVAARAVEAKKLLEAVTAQASVRLDLIEYPSAPPMLSLSFEKVEMDQGIQRILDVLRLQTPISYVLLYGMDGRGGLERVVVAFGEGGNSPVVPLTGPRPEPPTPTPSVWTPQSLPPDIESKLPAPVKERLGRWQKGWGEIRSLIDERRQKADVAPR